MAQYPTSTLEASKMLEAALEQMDGIIQGTKYDHPSTVNQQNCSTTNDLNLNLSNLHSNFRSASSSSQPNVSELLDSMKRLHLAIQKIPQDTCLRLSVRERDIEDSIFNWLEGRRRAEGIGREFEDMRNFNYEFSGLEERITKLEEENHSLKEQVNVKNGHISELKKTVLEVSNEKHCHPGENAKLEGTLNVTDGLDTGCGDALNTSTPTTAIQSEHIQLKNRCSDLEKENLELRKLCGGNRTPKYLDLNNSNRRYNTNAQLATSPLSSSISDHEMSPMEQQKPFPSEPTGPTEYAHVNNNPSPKSSKGLRRIFSKIKRSNSGGTIGGEQTQNQQANSKQQQQQVPPPQQTMILPQQNNPFSRRDRFRATTGGPRFKASSITDTSNETTGVRRPFNQWTLDMLSIWMDSLGLGIYDNHLKHSGIRNGEGLASMHGHDLEAKLGMKMPLHRKKLILAVASRQDSSVNPNSKPRSVDAANKDALVDSAGKLDHLWVTRWLDDIGLPQYKEAFLDARVDGRVLNVLTIDDLIFELGVGSLLHHLSIRRAIQVLRQKNFDPNCLKRRSSPEENDRDVVQLWTNHRVMEWLKEVDLAEYAPNLRGSGVHGALIMYEPRFDDVLLADLLSIPSSKTLLRRHLSIHFKEVVGRDIMQRKRNLGQQEAISGFSHNTPLTPTSKAKSKSRQGTTGAFTLRRKKSKSHFDYGDLVCPFSTNAPNNSPVGR